MRPLLAVLISLLLSFVSTGVFASEGVVQTVGHGQINWTTSQITATGSGAPSLKAANVAVARIGAERAAKMDAFRNILEAVKGARVSGSTSVENLMSKSPEMQSQVQGVIRNFKVIDTKYYSDGGVDVIVTVPLTGILFDSIVKTTGSKKAVGEPTTVTGVVIQAKGLKAQPALAPNIQDADGNDIFSAAFVDPEIARKQGVVAYATSLDSALKDPRVI